MTSIPAPVPALATLATVATELIGACVEPDGPKYLRPVQAARLLDVDRSTVWRHRNDPQWGLVYKQMPSGEYRYREDTVRALAARGGPPPEEPAAVETP